MKFTAVRFSTSVVVFDDRAVGVLKTYANESSLAVLSIEVVGPLLVITREHPMTGVTECKAVPLSKVESADPDIASLLAETAEPARRGPGRPTNASKALEAQGT